VTREYHQLSLRLQISRASLSSVSSGVHTGGSYVYGILKMLILMSQTVVVLNGLSIKTTCVSNNVHCDYPDDNSLLHSYRSVRNLIIDLRRMNATAPAIGIHWQVSQATSLINIVVEMSQENGTQHQGIGSHA
jgi:hypothetical protein